MADQKKSVGEKVQEALENLGKAVDEWLARQGLKPQLIPVPIDRPHPRRRLRR